MIVWMVPASLLVVFGFAALGTGVVRTSRQLRIEMVRTDALRRRLASLETKVGYAAENQAQTREEIASLTRSTTWIDGTVRELLKALL